MRRVLIYICLVVALCLQGQVCPAFAEDEGLGTEKDTVSIDEITLVGLGRGIAVAKGRIDASSNKLFVDDFIARYDVYLNGSAKYGRENLDISGAATVPVYTQVYDIDISKLFQTATTITASAGYQRESTFGFGGVSRQAELSLSLQQELLQDPFGASSRRQLKAIYLDIEALDLGVLENIEGYIAALQKAYWRYVKAKEDYNDALKLYKDARRLLEIYRKKVRLGSADEADKEAARANLFTRKIELKTYELGVQTAEADLLYLLNMPQGKSLPPPADELQVANPIVPDWEKALEEAVISNRVLNRKQVELASAELIRENKRLMLMPSLKALLGVAFNGVGNDATGSLERLADGVHNNVWAGVLFSMPWSNTANRAQLERTEADIKRLKLEIEDYENAIAKDVFVILKKLDALKRQIELAKESLKANEAKYKYEREKIAQGRTTVDVVIRYSADVIASKMRLNELYLMYRTTMIDLKRVQSSLLDKYVKDIKSFLEEDGRQ